MENQVEKSYYEQLVIQDHTGKYLPELVQPKNKNKYSYVHKIM